ncbi:hypothetical protein JZ751_020679 [Albula glossodonta]|uniref:Uncharacterized protein n=1 Tax=Albula glossodonta TaxID=121402 RepID=A0A8T2PKB3_9TELE|nr:hypothetical protein JZ751_020679 [Albula glossodonta]
MLLSKRSIYIAGMAHNSDIVLFENPGQDLGGKNTENTFFARSCNDELAVQGQAELLKRRGVDAGPFTHRIDQHDCVSEV